LTFSNSRRAAEARFLFALAANRRFRFARSSLAVASDYTAPPFFCNRTPAFPPRRRKRRRRDDVFLRPDARFPAALSQTMTPRRRLFATGRPISLRANASVTPP